MANSAGRKRTNAIRATTRPKRLPHLTRRALIPIVSANVADEPPDSQTFDYSTRVHPGGSIRLVCLGTALPLANLLDRDRGVAPPPGPLLGVPSVQWAAKHRPYVAGKREAHPQRLPVHFFSCSHRQTIDYQVNLT